ncbi:MAG TPA: Rieske 2Fe-2S domain-containing protein [Nitriliruptorales bacterium]|nr:Rieske 2Fe-2S domain-containing protein [Nitriliruptorales bacterium]
MAEIGQRAPAWNLPSVKRRDFLRVALLAGTAGGLGAFGAASLGFLWPSLAEGFGAKLNVSEQVGQSAQEILADIEGEKAPLEFPSGRLYVVTWDPGIAGAEEAYGEDHVILDNGKGLMALYQKCVHLGCRVPWCQSSQWFECPCHGSKYNRWGEWVGGPAPRGLDRFPSELEGDSLVVDTGTILTGPARTARVLQQEPEGPHCIDI